MAADPVAAATALAGQTYAGAQERTASTQKALLDSLAANGTYQNSLNTAATAAAAPAAPAPAMASAGGGPNASMSGQMDSIAGQGATQVNTMGHAALAAATALAAHQAMQTQQANTDYFAKAAAAMPLEQSRAASAGAQILGDLQAKREAAAAAKEQAAMQLQISQVELQKAKVAAATASAKGGFASPNEALAFKDSAEKSAGVTAFGSLLGTAQDANGKTISVKTPAYEAASYLATHPGSTMQDVLQHVPGVQNTDEQAIADAVNQYNSNLAQVNYFGLMGYQPPAPITPTLMNQLRAKNPGIHVW